MFQVLFALCDIYALCYARMVNTMLNKSVAAGEEFCHYDTFRGRCWRGEVIVMTSALWGRMKIGRCVEIHPSFMDTHGKDPLFLGCFADVLQIADRKCSGKPECDIKIADPEFDNIKPCYTGLTTYFEASFRCVRGEFFTSSHRPYYLVYHDNYSVSRPITNFSK